VDGEIHMPFCSRPKPFQISRDRRTWRSRRHGSGSENPSTVQVPSQSRLTAPICQTRAWPSRSTASLRGVSPKYD
jgi:hypothetical protein